MPASLEPAKVRVGRRLLRASCTFTLVLLIGVVCAGLYLNRVGVPAFITRRILDGLRTTGVEAQAARMRLSLYRGLVAENVVVTRTPDRPGQRTSTFSAKAVEIFPQSLRMRWPFFAIKRFVVKEGSFCVVVQPPGLPPKTIRLENIRTELRRQRQDQFVVESCDANFSGIRLNLKGRITHGAVPERLNKRFTEATRPTGQLESNLWRVAHLFEQIKFDGVPVVRLDVAGDVTEPESFSGLATAIVPRAETPWGRISNAALTFRVNNRTNASVGPVATLHLALGQISTRWGYATDMDAHVAWTAEEARPDILVASAHLRTGHLATEFGETGPLSLDAQWWHPMTNPIPLHVTGKLDSAQLVTRFGSASCFSARVGLSRKQPHALSPPEPELAWWNKLGWVRINAGVELAGVAAHELRVEAIRCEINWDMPEFALSNVQVRFPTGHLQGGLALDVHTRRTEFGCASDFDIREIAPLLTAPVRNWLLKFDWETPPKIKLQGAATLPAWTNCHPDWRAELQPKFQCWGELQAGPASYRGVQVSAARTHFLYSNMCWYLPDLFITRPEGCVSASCISSDVTRDIYWRVSGDVHPAALQSVLDGTSTRGLAHLTLSQPVRVELELWGTRTEKLPRGAAGWAALSNFTFRGEQIGSFSTGLSFTNDVLTLLNPVAMAAEQLVQAESVRVDFRSKKVHITNARGCADPMLVARVIGPKVARAISPYQFREPPQAHVNGSVPFHGTTGTELVFALDGGPFRWWRFNLDRVGGRVEWVNKNVRLNVEEADLYGGKLAGSAQFDFRPDRCAQFRFDARFTNLNLQLLIQDVSPRTNRLEGVLTGRLQIDYADTLNWASWVGTGRVHLQDGYVWELPLFSVFSPVLDAVVPGLGNSRFTDGATEFTITNGLISFSRLELRAPLLRMKLRGSVDFHERVDARVEAELLRETWLIGQLLSTALSPLPKIFEYKLSGTLTDPRAEPVYLPKLLLAPLQPARLLKSLFPQGPNGNRSTQ